MKIEIRQEKSDDYPLVAEAIELAYKDVPYSNHQEQFMVERLRNSDAFVSELSLVAEVDQEIVGHILLTKIFIHGEGKPIPSLALAPLSVVPLFQGNCVGGSLVAESHRIAAEMGYGSIVVLGPGAYYCRFGYEKTTKYGLTVPFDVSEDNRRVICLNDGRASELTGRVEYHPAWWSNATPNSPV